MRHVCWGVLCVLMPIAARASDYVWVEAESAVDKVEHANEWYEPVDRQTSLSGGDWWRSFDEPVMDSGYMVWPFSVPNAGKYRLWIRLNLTSTGYRYALDDAPLAELPVKAWRAADQENRETIEHERRVFDETYASHDGSNRHKLAWIKGPEVELAQGGAGSPAAARSKRAANGTTASRSCAKGAIRCWSKTRTPRSRSRTRPCTKGQLWTSMACRWTSRWRSSGAATA